MNTQYRIIRDSVPDTRPWTNTEYLLLVEVLDTESQKWKPIQPPQNHPHANSIYFPDKEHLIYEDVLSMYPDATIWKDDCITIRNHRNVLLKRAIPHFELARIFLLNAMEQENPKSDASVAIDGLILNAGGMCSDIQRMIGEDHE